MTTVQEALNTAVVHHQAGRFQEAAEIYRRVLAADPQQAGALHLLGLIAHQTGDHQTAVHYISRAVVIDSSQAVMHSNLGGAFRSLGRLNEARACCETAVRLKPDYVEAHNNLGLVLREQGRLAEAAEAYRTALGYRPDMAEVHFNLGYVLAEMGDLEGAIAADLEAVRLDPDQHDALVHLSLIQTDLGRLDEAIEYCNRALAIRPDSPEAHSSRALAWLMQGNLAQGWPEYEWRWKTKTQPPRPFFTPRWDGSPPAGRTILLHVEQGLGDALQFIRYAPLVQQLGAKVIIECASSLVPILSTCAGIDRFASPGRPLPPFDLHAPLLSVPGLLGTTLDTMPADVPYLHARPELIDYWRRELAPVAGFKIGIAWQGNATYRGDRWRSIPLAEFEPLARVPGVQLVSLQKGPGAEQLAGIAGRFEVVDLGSRLDATGDAFVDTAAVMKNLDLVITSDTSIAHLAGALAVPVWVALPVSVDWRWFQQRTDSPWYPTMRLFRQSQLGQWAPVFAEIATAIERVIETSKGQ